MSLLYAGWNISLISLCNERYVQLHGITNVSATTNGELNNNEVCNGTVFLIISRIGGRPHVAVTDVLDK